jgi:hypothetical protein
VAGLARGKVLDYGVGGKLGLLSQLLHVRWTKVAVAQLGRDFGWARR